MKNKRAALEMSVGTIVTIVLLMSVLILGIFLIQKIFGASTNAIDSINNQVEDQINKLFAQDGTKIAIYPTSRDITIKKKDDPKGFAFSIKNLDVETADFSYETVASDVSKCGSAFTKEEAESYLLGGSGNFELGPGNSLDVARLIKLDLSETAPPCTMIYYLQVDKDGDAYASADIFVTIK